MRLRVNDQGDIVLSEVFNGIGIETDIGTYGIAQRDGGCEITLNGEVIHCPTTTNVPETSPETTNYIFQPNAATHVLKSLKRESPLKRESLAAYAHDAWSRWMRYLFSKCVETTGGDAIIPAESVARWKRQMETTYADLPGKEKLSDLAEADRIGRIFDLKMPGEVVP